MAKILGYYKKSYGVKTGKRSKYFKKKLGPRGRGRNTHVKGSVSLGKGFPLKIQETHTYCEQFYINTGASGALNKYQFSANGMYDPNITSSGHQPMYFDQFTALYDHYCVIGSRMDVTFVPATANNPAAVIGVYMEDDTVLTPTLPAIMEQQTVKCHQTVYNDNLPHHFSLSWSAKDYFGGTPLSNNDLQGTASTNPNEQSYYTLFTDSSLSVNVSNWVAKVKITYIAVWKEVKPIDYS